MIVRLVILIILFAMLPLDFYCGLVLVSLLIRSRNSPLLIGMFFFLATYIMPMSLFLRKGIYLGFYNDWLSKDLAFQVLLLFSICLSVVYIVLKMPGRLMVFQHKLSLLYYLSTLLLIVLSFAPMGSTILNVDSYSEIQSSRFIIPIEYGLMFVFFIVTYVRMRKYMLLLIAVFCLKYLLLGMRVAILEVFILLALRWRIKLSIPSVGLILLLLFGSNYFALWRAGLPVNWVFIFSDINFSNATDVFYSSVRLHGLSNNGFIDTLDGLLSAIRMFFGVFFPISIGGIGNLSVYMKETYGSGGGALFSSVLYAQLGILGAIGFSVFIGWVLNKYRYVKSSYSIWLIYLNATIFMFPRWLVYYPSQLFKFNLYAVMLFLICKRLEVYVKR